MHRLKVFPTVMLDEKVIEQVSIYKYPSILLEENVFQASYTVSSKETWRKVWVYYQNKACAYYLVRGT